MITGTQVQALALEKLSHKTTCHMAAK